MVNAPFDTNILVDDLDAVPEAEPNFSATRRLRNAPSVLFESIASNCRMP